MNLVIESSSLILSSLMTIARAVINFVALAMRIGVSRSDCETSRPGAECSYSKTVVFPIDALMENVVFCRNLKPFSTASGMLKFEVLG